MTIPWQLLSIVTMILSLVSLLIAGVMGSSQDLLRRRRMIWWVFVANFFANLSYVLLCLHCSGATRS